MELRKYASICDDVGRQTPPHTIRCERSIGALEPHS
jgi:hypothetical protein